MVRLINDNNIDTVSNVVYRVLSVQKLITHIKNINAPKISPCIYAMWHANQFCVHGFENKGNVNVLISNSIDGEIVARVCRNWGFQVVRGSSKRKGAVSSTLQLIEKLKSGESVAIMVDGPQGPLHKVKHGAIRLAKDTGVPIIPAGWYSDNLTFVKFPSWDKMTTPFGPCYIINQYGDPIYIDKNDDENEACLKVKQALEDLDNKMPETFKKEKKQTRLWNWK